MMNTPHRSQAAPILAELPEGGTVDLVHVAEAARQLVEAMKRIPGDALRELAKHVRAGSLAAFKLRGPNQYAEWVTDAAVWRAGQPGNAEGWVMRRGASAGGQRALDVPRGWGASPMSRVWVEAKDPIPAVTGAAGLADMLEGCAAVPNALACVATLGAGVRADELEALVHELTHRPPAAAVRPVGAVRVPTVCGLAETATGSFQPVVYLSGLVECLAAALPAPPKHARAELRRRLAVDTAPLFLMAAGSEDAAYLVTDTEPWRPAIPGLTGRAGALDAFELCAANGAEQAAPDLVEKVRALAMFETDAHRVFPELAPVRSWWEGELQPMRAALPGPDARPFVQTRRAAPTAGAQALPVEADEEGFGPLQAGPGGADRLVTLVEVVRHVRQAQGTSLVLGWAEVRRVLNERGPVSLYVRRPHDFAEVLAADAGFPHPNPGRRVRGSLLTGAIEPRPVVPVLDWIGLMLQRDGDSAGSQVNCIAMLARDARRLFGCDHRSAAASGAAWHIVAEPMQSASTGVAPTVQVIDPAPRGPAVGIAPVPPVSPWTPERMYSRLAELEAEGLRAPMDALVAELARNGVVLSKRQVQRKVKEFRDAESAAAGLWGQLIASAGNTAKGTAKRR